MEAGETSAVGRAGVLVLLEELDGMLVVVGVCDENEELGVALLSDEDIVSVAVAEDIAKAGTVVIDAWDCVNWPPVCIPVALTRSGLVWVAGCGAYSVLRLPSGSYEASPGPAGGSEFTIDGCPFFPRTKLESSLRLWSMLAKNGMREIKDISIVSLGVYARLALSYQSP